MKEINSVELASSVISLCFDALTCFAFRCFVPRSEQTCCRHAGLVSASPSLLRGLAGQARNDALNQYIAIIPTPFNFLLLDFANDILCLFSFYLFLFFSPACLIASLRITWRLTIGQHGGIPPDNPEACYRIDRRYSAPSTL